MCGIASTFLLPERRSPQVWQAIRENFTANLLFNEKRGEAATGLAVMDISGKLQVYKQPVSAHKFIETDIYLEILNSLNSETVLILGHTRLPTKGAPSNNANNHPLQAGPVCGIHNGHILNDDALFARWGFTRQAQVDSEIIFRLLEDCHNHSLATESLLKDLKAKLNSLEGRFTFLAADSRLPGRLLVVKHNNPISLHYSQDWHSLIFSSSYIFLRKTFGRVVVGESLANHHLAVFDVAYLNQLQAIPRHSLLFTDLLSTNLE